MRHRVVHDLAPELARRVAERAFASYAARYAKYQPELAWQSATRATASFRARGITVGGSIELEPGAIAFELEVPWLLRIFEGRAIATVEREVRVWEQAALRGEL
jgi:hypothetical protein